MTMVLARDDVAAMPDHAVRGRDVDALAAILLLSVNLAIWARSYVPAVPAGDALMAVDDVTLMVDADRAREPLSTALRAAGYAERYVAALAADIAMLAAAFGRLLDSEQVAIRLDVVETDACRRFHGDQVGVRLICTYAGPGTQWLADDEVARWQGGTPVDELDVRQIPAGDVALFKGRDRAPERPIIHRSPPIAGTGCCRLVLVIDAARDWTERSAVM
ncbi:DUF1826 domain-containing protein [Sphingomonas mollis]|uniref:DUF1826 domain-containing protein n=1 Tax=Sphingomonas mollis TaxID=2795726 RepID=A0ABS0XUJ8_9SPHN|nr:DUF1826 domain-containing protein [Sphingomonas sp. BT553]MBJ6123698.1 DUF1826 domain-containing protein [Sphingomonas sp. BT553]